MTRCDQVGTALRERYGIAPRSRWDDEVERAVQSVARRHGLRPSVAPSTVVGSPTLLREVAEGMTVGESYFFRHRPQLELVAGALAKRLEGGEPAVAWSAGCCRGEEPYSLAILLDERIVPHMWGGVRMIGSDIHGDSIEAARLARYSEWSLRNVDSICRSRYFRGEGKLELRAEARARVNFVKTTLQDHLAQMSPESVDVVLFRNVALYMTPDLLDRLYRGFEQILRPGGLLIIAPSDPPPLLGRRSLLEPMSTAVYRRVSSHELLPPPPPHVPPPTRTPARAEARAESVKTVRMGIALADRGHLDGALRLLDQVIEDHPSLNEARVARAEVLFAAHRFEEVLREAELATTTDMGLASLEYMAALSLVELDRRTEALERLEALATKLSGYPDSETLLDRTTRTDELLAAVDHEIARLR